MPILDRAQDLIEACVAIVSADTEIRTLAGRTTDLIWPWESLAVDAPMPMLVYAMQDGSLATRNAGLNTERYELHFAAFAERRRDANRLAARIPQILTWTALNARGVDACLDPELSYVRRFIAHTPDPDSKAKARADVFVNLLVTL